MHELVNCGIAKQCIEALQKSMPSTKANSAALHLILSSIPKELTYPVARMTAYDALNWICSKYLGGIRQVHQSMSGLGGCPRRAMTREETLEQYVFRKHNLYENLLDNQHPITPDDLTKCIIDGLPPEFGPDEHPCMPLVLEMILMSF
jgi:hypothetical protein